MEDRESIPDPGESRSGAAQRPDVGPSAFFPFGTPCPGCGYTLTGCEPGSCPECGAVTLDLAYPGLVREMTPEERERAEPAGSRVPRWSEVAKRSLLVFQAPLGVAFLLVFVVVVVFPLLRSIEQSRAATHVVVRAGLSSLALFVLMLIGQFVYSWWSHCGTDRRGRAAWTDDLEAGRVEEYHHEVTHAMRVTAADSEWLLLRLRGGHVLRLTAEGQRSVRGGPVLEVCGRLRLVSLPRCHAIVGLEFDGEPIDVPLREDLRPRHGLAEADRPIAGVDRVERVLVTRGAVVPPFAPVAQTRSGKTLG